MADIILHRRSFDTGSVPTTESLGVAQFAINVPDGKVFIHKSSSVSESIVSVVTTDSITTGSITLTATASAGLFVGTFTGSFSGVTSNADTASMAYQIDVRVQNKTGVTIPKGKVVRVSGSAGDNPLITTASYISEKLSANTLGITLEDITNDGSGSVITQGVLTGVSTTGFVAGDMLYLSSSGAYTNVEPIAPLHGVRLGEVLRVHASQGSILVNIDNGQELGESHDVIDSSTTASFGDLLVKSGSVWINSKNLTGSYNLTGSLTVSNSFDLVGIQKITGSLIVSNSFSLIGTQELTGSFFLTGSLIGSSSVIRLHQSASVSGTNIFGTASYSDTASFVRNSVVKMVYVSSGSGLDTNDGTALRPVKTISQSLVLMGNQAGRIAIHPGTYSENVTVSQANVTLASSTPGLGADTVINGFLTLSSSAGATKLRDITVSTITHVGTDNLYLDNVSVSTAFVKQGNGAYVDIQNSSIQGSSNSTITGAGTVVIRNSKDQFIYVNNSAAVVTIKDSISSVYPYLAAGTLAIFNGILYSLSSGSTALTTLAGTTVGLTNTQVFNPLGGVERVILGGNYSFEDVTFNRTNSTFGTSVASRGHFQQIHADGITGSIAGTASVALTALTASYASQASLMDGGSF